MAAAPIPAAPVNLYVDYLDIDGNLVERRRRRLDGLVLQAGVGSVELVAGRANLKLITVTATVRVAAQGGNGSVPLSTVSALKTSPF